MLSSHKTGYDTRAVISMVILTGSLAVIRQSLVPTTLLARLEEALIRLSLPRFWLLLFEE